MATPAIPINDAPEQIQAWIDEIDVSISELTLRRIALSRAAETFASPVIAKVGEDSTQIEAVVDRARAETLSRPKTRRAKTASKPPASKQATPKGGSKYDYAEVARVANAALRAKEPMSRAIAQRFSCSPAMASFLIVEARKRGQIIAKGNGGHKSAATNVTPIVKPAQPSHTSPPAGGAFTPVDTLRLLDR